MPPTTPLKTLRAVIVDDDELFAESLTALLAGEEGIDVVGWASNGVDGVDLVGAENPDVVVMDLAMPQMGGIEAAKIIGRIAPETRIILLSGSLMGEELERIAGTTRADAYVTKARVALDLVPALRAGAERTN
jgi:DNA-binding NarL/FixJ family response regulator